VHDEADHIGAEGVALGQDLVELPSLVEARRPRSVLMLPLSDSAVSTVPTRRSCTGACAVEVGLVGLGHGQGDHASMPSWPPLAALASGL
jgi:hypothetical protein